MNTDEMTRRIAEANDIARTAGVLTVAVTRGMAERFRRAEGLPAAQVLQRVTRHEFPDNTSSAQHDFAYVMCGGVEVWWRILPPPGADACDPSKERVLILFMPAEYPEVERMMWR